MPFLSYIFFFKYEYFEQMSYCSHFSLPYYVVIYNLGLGPRGLQKMLLEGINFRRILFFTY